MDTDKPPKLVELEEITPDDIEDYYSKYKSYIDCHEINRKCLIAAKFVTAQNGFLWKAAKLSVIGTDFRVVFITKKKPKNVVYIMENNNGEPAKQVRKRSMRWWSLKLGCWIASNFTELIKFGVSVALQGTNQNYEAAGDMLTFSSFEIEPTDTYRVPTSQEISAMRSVLREVEFRSQNQQATENAAKPIDTCVLIMCNNDDGKLLVYGSGFYYGNGWFITCSHVINDGKFLANSNVHFLPNGPTLQERDGRICFFARSDNPNSYRDFAIFRAFEDEMPGLPPGLMSFDANPGQFWPKEHESTTCYHFGGYMRRPYGLPRISREEVMKLTEDTGCFYRARGTTECGSSGGPVFDTDSNKLVGMHVKEIDQDSTALAQGFPVIQSFMTDVEAATQMARGILSNDDLSRFLEERGINVFTNYALPEVLDEMETEDFPEI